MKKLHVILLLILVLALGILGGIYIDKSSKTNGISEQEAFERNLECQEYLSGFIKDNTPKLGGSIDSVGIFYSPRENSCIGYLHFYDSWEDEDGVSRIYDSYTIDGLHGSTKESSYTKDWWPKLGEITCKINSDFRGKIGEYDCELDDIFSFNYKGKELWEKEIEWLKKN